MIDYIEKVDSANFELLKKINDFKVNLGKIEKKGKNDFIKAGYKYWRLPDLYEAIVYPLNRQGIYYEITPTYLQNDIWRITLKFIDLNTRGIKEYEFDACIDNGAVGKANKLQGFGSMLTYVERYGLQAIFSLSDGKDDPDAYKPKQTNSKLITEKQKAEFRAKYGGLSSDEKLGLLSKVNLTPATFNQMTNEQFKELMK